MMFNTTDFYSLMILLGLLLGYSLWRVFEYYRQKPTRRHLYTSPSIISAGHTPLSPAELRLNIISFLPHPTPNSRHNHPILYATIAQLQALMEASLHDAQSSTTPPLPHPIYEQTLRDIREQAATIIKTAYPDLATFTSEYALQQHTKRVDKLDEQQIPNAIRGLNVLTLCKISVPIRINGVLEDFACLWQTVVDQQHSGQSFSRNYEILTEGADASQVNIALDTVHLKELAEIAAAQAHQQAAPSC